MAIITEENVRTNNIRDIALKMMLAARTAPKARGVDNLAIAIAEKDDIIKISDEMRIIAKLPENTAMASSFLRDADNILTAEVLLLLGTKIVPIGIQYCGLCGFKSCQNKMQHPDVPCAFNTGDLGIALGSAVSIAMDHRVDNRVMYTVGMAVRNLGILGDDIKVCFGVPLSVSGKNTFFDRKPK